MSEPNVFGQPDEEQVERVRNLKDKSWKNNNDPLERAHGENPYKAMTGVDFSEEKLVDKSLLPKGFDPIFPKNVNVEKVDEGQYVASYATKNDRHAEQIERQWRLVDDGNPLSPGEKLEYKFNEGKNIEELKRYIDGTYHSHYSKNKFQSTEFIVDCGHGDGFCLGNIIKYAQRYGKKNGKDRKDLLKIMHYAIIALSILDNEDK